MTAHVLITLVELISGGVIEGNIRADTATAIQGAIGYLERKLSTLSDPYLITITTYALTTANSNKKYHAFLIMQNIHRLTLGIFCFSYFNYYL